jgi:hypothetical protein
MFDLMQYALIFYDFQLILAQMGSALETQPRHSRACHGGARRHARAKPGGAIGLRGSARRRWAIPIPRRSPPGSCQRPPESQRAARPANHAYGTFEQPLAAARLPPRP